MNYRDNYNHKNNHSAIEAIAEQWVNLIFAQLQYKKRNKKENKNGKTKQ